MVMHAQAEIRAIMKGRLCDIPPLLLGDVIEHHGIRCDYVCSKEQDIWVVVVENAPCRY